jgi:hypothetical protein
VKTCGLNTESRKFETAVPAYQGKMRLSKGGLNAARDGTGIWLGCLQLMEKIEATRG